MIAKRLCKFDPDYAIPPGETLRETMEFQDIGNEELAERTGLTEDEVADIIKGEKPITNEIAERLEENTGIPARIWNNLEAFYREQLEKLKKEK